MHRYHQLALILFWGLHLGSVLASVINPIGSGLVKRQQPPPACGARGSPRNTGVLRFGCSQLVVERLDP